MKSLPLVSRGSSNSLETAPLLSALLIGLISTNLHAASAKTPTWDDDIRPIFKARCFKCHSDDEQKSELNLQTLATALKGGSDGEVLKSGRPNSSLLLKSINHEEGVEVMPPKSPKMPDEEIELVRAWILGGMPENAGSKVTAPSAFVMKSGPTDAKPANPAMPKNLPPAPPAPPRGNPVNALAASPWAPLIARGGNGYVAFFNTDTRAPLGAITFPEGTPQVLRFSRDGAVLLVAGGKPVQTGKVALYDVATGKRLATFADETDTILAADFSPDGKLVAIGGPNKTVKVFTIATGKMAYKITKHTDWITALEFSPDGKRLATADRSGGIHVWDSASGGISVSLSEHRESVVSIAWRPDGQIIASGSEDGSVILWNISDGFPSATLTAIHTPVSEGKRYGKVPGGVLSVSWTLDGHLLTVGRDNVAREWDDKGKKLRACGQLSALPTRVIGTFDNKLAVIGDTEGHLLWWPRGTSSATP